MVWVNARSVIEHARRHDADADSTSPLPHQALPHIGISFPRKCHLLVDVGLPEPLHYVASQEAAETFAREACSNGWVRSVLIDTHVVDAYPEMPCQTLFSTLPALITPLRRAAD